MFRCEVLEQVSKPECIGKYIFLYLTLSTNDNWRSYYRVSYTFRFHRNVLQLAVAAMLTVPAQTSNSPTNTKTYRFGKVKDKMYNKPEENKVNLHKFHRFRNINKTRKQDLATLSPVPRWKRKHLFQHPVDQSCALSAKQGREVIGDDSLIAPQAWNQLWSAYSRLVGKNN